MKIVWDDKKNQKLILERGISFEDVASLVLKNKILDIVKNPSRSGQFYFVLNLNEYTHLAPFIINKNGEIVLKTIFPSRQYHKKYGRKK